jgi:hypothetical protein
LFIDIICFISSPTPILTYTDMGNDHDRDNLRTKWGNRFIIAAIIQGGIMTGMALVIVAFQLSSTDVDIIHSCLYPLKDLQNGSLLESSFI